MVGGNRLEDSCDIEETSSLEKANVQRVIISLPYRLTETSIAIPVQWFFPPSADWKNHRKR